MEIVDQLLCRRSDGIPFGIGEGSDFTLGACLRSAIVKPCNQHITQALQLAEQMLNLADQGDTDREDNGCGILYGVLRDSAFKLRKLAEEEKRSHIRKGWWPDAER